MSGDGFNMSMRKFLKRVGVTSQQKIEEVVRQGRASGALAGKSAITAQVTLTIEGLDAPHVVEGEISLADEV